MSSSCSNSSSNIIGHVNVYDISNGARLLMTLNSTGFSGGFTAGDAVRYDSDVDSPSYGYYVTAQADNPAHSEVVGVIEDISVGRLNDITTELPYGSDSSVNIVTNGQIKYPEGKLKESYEFPGSTGSGGGNDIYFLSAATAGILQNLAPTEPTQVIKPIYQVSPDDPFTGQVINYIGYQSGGQIVAEDSRQLPAGAISFVPEYTNSSGGSNRSWSRAGTKMNLRGNGEYGNTYYSVYGEIKNLCKTRTKIDCTGVSSKQFGKTVKVRDGKNTPLNKGKIVEFNSSLGYVVVEWPASNSSNLTTYLGSGVMTVSTGEILSMRGWEYYSFDLPSLSSNNTFSKINFDIDGKIMSMGMDAWFYTAPDKVAGTSSYGMAGTSVSIASTIDAKTITVETVVLNGETTTVTNLARWANEIQGKIDSLQVMVEGSAASTGSSYLE